MGGKDQKNYLVKNTEQQNIESTCTITSVQLLVVFSLVLITIKSFPTSEEDRSLGTLGTSKGSSSIMACIIMWFLTLITTNYSSYKQSSNTQNI